MRQRPEWLGLELGHLSIGAPGWRQVAVILATLSVMTVSVALATRYDDLPVLISVLLAVFGLVAGMRRPSLLLYVYVASIPFNFALPAGPVGTVGRVFGIVFVVGYLLSRVQVLRPGVMPVAAWAFVIWCLASSLWAIDPGLALSTWLSVAQLVCVTVLIASIVAEDPSEVGRILWVYSVSAVITAVLGILSYVQSSGRAAAFQGEDVALFASVLLPAIVYLTYCLVMPGTKVLIHAICAGGTSAGLVAVALSGTRSAWVGLAAAAIVWVVLRPSRRMVFGFGMAAAVLAALLFALPGASAFLMDRVNTAGATGGAGRTDIWSVGYTIFASSPVVGVGYGNFGLAFTPSAVELSSVSYAAIGLGRAPHNVLLGALAETGVIGASLLVATMLTVSLRVGRSGGGTVVLIALVALFAQSMFLDVLLQKQLWLLLALAIGIRAARGSERSNSGTRSIYGQPGSTRASRQVPSVVSTFTYTGFGPRVWSPPRGGSDFRPRALSPNPPMTSDPEH